MKIGIDARLYGTKHRGLGRYVKRLTDGLLASDKKNQYTIFLTSDNFEAISESKNVKKVLFEAGWYGAKEQFMGAGVFRKAKLDLMHFPHFNVPFFYNQKFIVTIHDLIIDHFPDSRATTLPDWKYKIKLLAYKKILSHAATCSIKIIVPSDFVKNDLMNLYKVPAKKIETVYEGYFLDKESDSDSENNKTKRFNLTKPFLLYVGAAYPHKNLERLIRVFKKLNQEKKYQLVLVGNTNYFYDRLKKETGNDENIIYTGYVAEAELAGLYQSALVYVFPSLHEGFGLPPIEAQAHNLPVVSSNQSSLPEILADSAVYFNPLDEKDMLNQIKRLLENPGLRQLLINKGRDNIKRFSWQNNVKKTLQIYNECLK